MNELLAWSEPAVDDWRRLPLEDAAAVARAVEPFPGEGLVVAAGPNEYLLLVGRYAVVMLVDGDAVRVDRVRRV